MQKERVKPILSVRVDADVLRRVDEISERTGIGRGEIVERCLVMGLEDQEEFIAWLQSPLRGPFLQMLTHPKVLNVVSRLMGQRFETEPTQAKVIEGVASRRKGRSKLKPREA